MAKEPLYPHAPKPKPGGNSQHHPEEPAGRRAISIPLTERSWGLILRALDQFAPEPDAARLRGYIERFLH